MQLCRPDRRVWTRPGRGRSAAGAGGAGRATDGGHDRRGRRRAAFVGERGGAVGIGYGPHLGFAYDVFGNGKTALRGGFGIFYDRNVGDDIFTFMLAQPPNLYNYSVPDTTVSSLTALCTGATCNPSGLYLSPVAIPARAAARRPPFVGRLRRRCSFC